MSNGSSSAVQLGFRGSTLIAWTWGGGTLISTTATNDSNWHHAVYTYDGTTDKIYVDGALAASGTSTHQTAAVTAAYLGTYNASGELFAGSLDDVRVYNRADLGGGGGHPGGGLVAVGHGGHAHLQHRRHDVGFVHACRRGRSPGRTRSTSVAAGPTRGRRSRGPGRSRCSRPARETPCKRTASTFAALTVNGSGGSYTLADNLTVTNALTLTAGTLAGGREDDHGRQRVRFGARSRGNAAITVGGNWAITSTGVVQRLGPHLGRRELDERGDLRRDGHGDPDRHGRRADNHVRRRPLRGADDQRRGRHLHVAGSARRPERRRHAHERHAGVGREHRARRQHRGRLRRRCRRGPGP